MLKDMVMRLGYLVLNDSVAACVVLVLVSPVLFMPLSKEFHVFVGFD